MNYNILITTYQPEESDKGKTIGCKMDKIALTKILYSSSGGI